MFYLAVLSIILILRTYMSILQSEFKGSAVRAIVNRNFSKFILRIVALIFYSFPAATVNSAIDYLNDKLGLYFRENITKHLQRRYLESLCFYKVTNLDTRIVNPDQIFTADVEKFSYAMSRLYNNLTKPVLDTVLFMRDLAKTMGYGGPTVMISWYLICAVILKFIAPPFGKYIALEQSKL